MNMTRHDLTTQIFYKSLFEAAERFYEKDPATALEIYRSFFRYAFGVTDDIVTNNEVAELLVKQTVPNLDISTENYLRACSQGPKGKENGGGIGRPRKGETPEEYQKRVEEWKQSKNPEKPLKGDIDNKILEENPVKNPVIEKTALQVSQNPEKPLTYTYASSLTNSLSKENTSIDKGKEIGNTIGKGIGKKVTTNTDTTDTSNSSDTKEYNIINIENIIENKPINEPQKENTYTEDMIHYIDNFLKNPHINFRLLDTDINGFRQSYETDIDYSNNYMNKKLGTGYTNNEFIELIKDRYHQLGE